MKKTRKFDPARAFRVCADMERMAARFYAEAARQTETPGIRDVFLRLAGTGTAHGEVFEEILKSKGTDKKFMKPFNAREMTSYIRHLTEKDTLGELAVRGRFTDKEAVRAGMEAAKVSILFYTELKNLSGPQAATVFERILKEEKGNYVMLSELSGETSDA